MSAELNTIRTLVSMHTRKLWVMAVFIILTGSRSGEITACDGAVTDNWHAGQHRALFRCQGLTVRCVMWCATACWVIHNFWLGSIGGTMIEGSFLVMNGLNIIRFRRMQNAELIRSKLKKRTRKGPSAQ